MISRPLPCSSPRRLPLALALALGLVPVAATGLVPSLARAQTPAPAPAGRGTIVGKVVDAASGETLIGVNVILKGTYYGAPSDLDGNFTITGINPGTYTIQVSLVGYATIQQTGVTVTAGAPLRLNFRLKEASLTIDKEVVVIGEKPLVDIEDASSTRSIGREVLEASPIENVQAAISTQAGVVNTSDGIHIRGARAYETSYYVDGVNAQDPLAGTGFGLEVATNALQDLEVTTSGVSAEFGDGTAGVVNARTKDGDEHYAMTLSHKRDNFGFNRDAASSFNEQLNEATLSGPEPITSKLLPALGIRIPGQLFFFSSGQVRFSDTFFGRPANRLVSSIAGEGWAPYEENAWSGQLKLTYNMAPGKRLQVAYRRSLAVNQNTQSLQITGNEVLLGPGYQYDFSLQPDNAATYTHDTQLQSITWTHSLGAKLFYTAIGSRFFTKLRADANGNPRQPAFLDRDYDPRSIVTSPVDLYSDPAGNLYPVPGPGLYNNGGLSPLWHDHFADEIGMKADVTFLPNETNRLGAGFEHKIQEYQWIDLVAPWAGAPLAPGQPVRSLGRSADVWHVYPHQGALYAQDQIRFKGLNAYLGLRLQYWMYGKLIDDAVKPIAEGGSPFVTDQTRTDYQRDTYPSLFGLRWRGRLLPRMRVSFPVSDNQVLYFNYGHASRIAHPRYIYAGLDPAYQERSFLSRLGNPNLNPETTVSYELGLSSQITTNDVLKLAAFYNDKFDYIVSRSLLLRDPSGRVTTRSFQVNQDYARIRGVEATYLKRIGRSISGSLAASYQVATGKSSSSNESAQQLQTLDEDITREHFLAWDRPLDVKLTTTFNLLPGANPTGLSFLNHTTLYLASTLRSGRRYTPAILNPNQPALDLGNGSFRPNYIPDQANQLSKQSTPWFWIDLSLARAITFGGTKLKLTLEVTNLFNNQNSVIINTVTGRAYEPGDDVLASTPDPKYYSFGAASTPLTDPSRYLEGRHVMLGVSYGL